jgi:L-alanine-DL-glutamate epimerase-like enolase superfamily enzyme
MPIAILVGFIGLLAVGLILTDYLLHSRWEAEVFAVAVTVEVVVPSAAIYGVFAVDGGRKVIAIDANQGYGVEEAIELSRMCSGLDIAWFEEPVTWQNDHRSMRDVRFRGPLPVCAGQSEFSPAACRELMEVGAVDILNFDASWSGGPTAWRKAAAIAGSYGVRVGHHEEPQVSSHLIASQSHGTVAECFHPDRDPFWWNLIANRPEAVDGWITLSDAPGLGWTLNEDYLAHHTVD